MGSTQKSLSDPSGELVKLVGYPQVVKNLGVSRSTIERAVKDGELPAPRHIKRRALWLVSDINEWASRLFDGRLDALDRAAAVDPDDLSPSEITNQAIKLAVAVVSNHVKGPVDPEHVSFSYRPPLPTNHDDSDAHHELVMSILERQFCDFDEVRSAIFAAWLFPPLRTMFQWETDELAEQMNNPDQIRSLALLCLDTEEWEKFVEEAAQAKAEKRPG